MIASHLRFPRGRHAALRCAAAAAAMALFAGAAAAATGDIAQGEKLARRWCAACHVVAGDQARGGDAVPTFAAIARRRGFDGAKLTGFLRYPHPKMPDMQLSSREAADLAAYIASQGK